MDTFELALARSLVQKEAYTWFPPGVLFPELSLFKSNGARGILVRIVRGGEIESLDQLLKSSFDEAKEILKDHPYQAITVLQFITYLSSPDEHLIRVLSNLERHDTAPDIAVYTAWFDFENKAYSSNLPWFSKGILPKSVILEAADHSQEPAELQVLQQEIVQILEERHAEWQNVYVQTSSKAVYSLLVIIVGMYLWMSSVGSVNSYYVLTKFGAKINERIVAGEYWRLVTPMFLHLHLLHLMVNAFALYSLRTAEWIFGSNRFLLIFLAAGVSGNVASFALSPYPAVGASGAIFGVLGALLYFGTQRRDFFRRTMGSAIWMTLAVNLLSGFMIPHISNEGHIGGLIGGFLASAALGLPKAPDRLYQPVAAVVLTSLLAIGIWRGFIS
ncbi:rhomboid family intramembrane serine protease [Effusibacillus consociatus]|uniref:Rhomboid family intramembrane serine protease n=1 Tax=Effusibacillus consociatus TaxID=1117041 RepID=A0ABV9Q544_9BACL